MQRAIDSVCCSAAWRAIVNHAFDLCVQYLETPRHRAELLRDARYLSETRMAGAAALAGGAPPWTR